MIAKENLILPYCKETREQEITTTKSKLHRFSNTYKAFIEEMIINRSMLG